MNENGKHLLCSDTGAPMYYVRMGENVRIERGFSNLYEQGKKAINDATIKGILRQIWSIR
jgi:tartrate dehydratase alpha subunit/fumarate hydratase class I-like protein